MEAAGAGRLLSWVIRHWNLVLFLLGLGRHRQRLLFATNLLLGGRVIVQRQPLPCRFIQGRPPVETHFFVLWEWCLGLAGGVLLRRLSFFDL